jgi:16S rRNA (cytosine967-C5)-methyltransferase
MTDKRPTLTLKPKAKAAAPAKRQGKPAAPRPAAPAARPAAAPQMRRAVEQGAAASGAGHQSESRLRHSHELKNPVQLAFRPDLKADSLAFALLGAAASLARVRSGTALPQALQETFEAYEAAPQARGAIQDIAYRTMRQLGRSEVLLGLMTTKAPEPAMLAGLLQCALALLDTPEGVDPPYEAFTVVDQAVGAAAAHPDFAHAKAMVNAVLRRFLRERAQLVAAALRSRWRNGIIRSGGSTVRIAYPDVAGDPEAGNRQPPLTCA